MRISGGGEFCFHSNSEVFGVFTVLDRNFVSCRHLSVNFLSIGGLTCFLRGQSMCIVKCED